MKKLKLDLDQVQVSSFAAEAPELGRGTVNGLSGTYDSTIFACGESHGLSCDSCFPQRCPRMPATD
ncbi:MAG TPA: hypothetical protein VFE05_13800 [Longimicrobiaceae bacterium]|jgi:hypothetical protein|nr:hypothetical protein [Longimicrobiaceae bacterium]